MSRPFPARPLHLGLALLLCASHPAGGDDPPQRNPAMLEIHLEMLRMEMRLDVLRTLVTQDGFYVPPAWPKRYQQEYTELALKAGAAAKSLDAEVESWQKLEDQERLDEGAALLKLLIEHAPKLVKAEKALLDAKHGKTLEASPEDPSKALYLQIDEFRKKQDLKALEVAKFMSNWHRKVLERGGAGGKVDDVINRWDERVAQAYRGALKDQGTILQKIQKHETARAGFEARIALLKEYETAFEIAQGASDPWGTICDKAEEKALEKADEYLKDRFADLNPEDGGMAVKDIFKKLKGEYFAPLKGAYDKAAELDKNLTLKGNPTALAAAKRFAVLGGLYKVSVQLLKDRHLLDGLGPLPAFLELYGNVLDLIPDLAIKLQEMVDTVDQRHKAVRALDAWNVTGMTPGDLRQIEAFEALGLQVATLANVDPTAANARFYMLVPKDVVPRGYATFDQEQLWRMAQAIADERVLNAPGEASRGIGAAAIENVLDLSLQTSPLASQQAISEAWLKSLKEAAKKTPFKPKDLLDLAFGQPVEVGKVQRTAAELRSRAESEIDILSVEQTIRTALGRYLHPFRKEWEEFIGVLRAHGLAFPPQQILKLYAYYHSSGASKERLGRVLKSLVEQRRAEAKAAPKAGIPVLTLVPPDLSVAAGGTTQMQGQVLVSGVDPARKAQAEVTWKAPAWAEAPAGAAKVPVQSGFVTVDLPLQVPVDPGGKDGKVQLTVKIPADPAGKSAVESAQEVARELPPEIGAPLAGPESIASLAPGDLTVTVTESFEVETVSGPLHIAVTRDPKRPVTRIEMYGELLDGLKEGGDIWLSIKLLSSVTAEGPFAEVKTAETAIHGGRKLADPAKAEGGWLTKERFFVMTGVPYGTALDQLPLCYQVVLDPINMYKGSLGQVKSEVARPSGKGLVLAGGETDAAGAVVTSLGRYLVRGTARVAYADRYCDVPGARLKVTSGGWSGYAFTKAVGADATSNPAVIQFPFAPGLAEVTVDCESAGVRANGKLKVARCEQGEAETKARAQSARKDAEEVVARLQKDLARVPERQADLDQKRQKEPDDWGHARDLVYLRYETRIKSEVEIPVEQTKIAAADALAAGNSSALLAAAQKATALRKLLWTLQEEQKAQLIQTTRASIPKAKSDSWRQSLESTLKSYETPDKEPLSKHQYWLLGDLDSLAEAAVAAGDAGTLDAARDEYFKLAAECGQTTFLPHEYLEWAEAAVLLTGDVAKGARLYQLALDAAKKEDPSGKGTTTSFLQDRKPVWLPK